LEIANSLPQRATDFRELPRPEDDEGDDQDHDQFRDADAEHAESSNANDSTNVTAGESDLSPALQAGDLVLIRNGRLFGKRSQRPAGAAPPNRRRPQDSVPRFDQLRDGEEVFRRPVRRHRTRPLAALVEVQTLLVVRGRVRMREVRGMTEL